MNLADATGNKTAGINAVMAALETIVKSQPAEDAAKPGARKAA